MCVCVYIFFLFFSVKFEQWNSFPSRSPDQSRLRSRVGVGGLVFFTAWTALLWVEWTWKQSAVDPVGKCTWTGSDKIKVVYFSSWNLKNKSRRTVLLSYMYECLWLAEARPSLFPAQTGSSQTVCERKGDVYKEWSKESGMKKEVLLCCPPVDTLVFMERSENTQVVKELVRLVCKCVLRIQDSCWRNKDHVTRLELHDSECHRCEQRDQLTVPAIQSYPSKGLTWWTPRSDEESPSSSDWKVTRRWTSFYRHVNMSHLTNHLHPGRLIQSYC